LTTRLSLAVPTKSLTLWYLICVMHQNCPANLVYNQQFNWCDYSHNLPGCWINRKKPNVSLIISRYFHD
jgi:hypothetical protein